MFDEQNRDGHFKVLIGWRTFTHVRGSLTELQGSLQEAFQRISSVRGGVTVFLTFFGAVAVK